MVVKGVPDGYTLELTSNDHTTKSSGMMLRVCSRTSLTELGGLR